MLTLVSWDLLWYCSGSVPKILYWMQRQVFFYQSTSFTGPLHLPVHLLAHKIRDPPMELLLLIYTVMINYIAMLAFGGFVLFVVLLTIASHKSTRMFCDLSKLSCVFPTWSYDTFPGHRPWPKSLFLFVHIIVQFLTMNNLHMPQVSPSDYEQLPGQIHKHRFPVSVLPVDCDMWGLAHL